MDKPSLPSAAELGVSEAEYERILRDLPQRFRVGGEPLAVRQRYGASLLQAQQHPVRGLLGVIAAVVVVLLAVGLVQTAAHDEPPTYAFLQAVGDRPVTYSSCHPIQVAVYPAGGPADAEQLVREAVTQMRGATGLDIVVIGSFGGYAPNWNFEAAPVSVNDPIVVSWQDGAAIAELTDEVIGLGGSRLVNSANGTPRWVAGTVALSRDYSAELSKRRDHAEALAVLLHEFGHVFGLAHVHSSAELMNARNVGRTTLGAGDREGLRLLGQGPCI
jgi:Matrixin